VTKAKGRIGAGGNQTGVNKLPARMNPFGLAKLKSQITNKYQITMSE
jgi:hypothetical protein